MMSCDPIQGQGHGGLKCAKMADFMAVSYTNMPVIQRLTVMILLDNMWILTGQVF